MCVATLGTSPSGGGVLKASSQMPPLTARLCIVRLDGLRHPSMGRSRQPSKAYKIGSFGGRGHLTKLPDRLGTGFGQNHQARGSWAVCSLKRMCTGIFL